MAARSPETVIAIYRVKPEREDEFLALLRDHYPTLKRAGLVTGEQPVVYRGSEKEGSQPIVFEIFTWKSAEGSRVAHETPEVARIWEAMGAMTEARDGRPALEFPHVERIDVAWNEA